MSTRTFHRFDSEGLPYFVTSVTLNRQPIFADPTIATLFLDSLYESRRRYGFLVMSFAVMPDHVHLLLLPDRRNSISDVMRFIKGAFARRLNVEKRGGGPVWQRSFYERIIRSEQALQDVLGVHRGEPGEGWICG